MDIEIRDFDSEKREVVGYAIPWGSEIDLGGIKETFTRGAIESVDVPLMFNHSEPVGSVIEGVDLEEGFAIRARISDTQKGNDIIQLLKDKAIRGLSVGFSPIDTDTSQGILNRMKVQLHEISLVAIPAYPEATILAYRSDDRATSSNEENKEEMRNMENNTEILDEITSLKEDVLNLQRNAVVTETKPNIKYRSYGDYIKGVAHGEDDALTLYRAWTGHGTSADSVFHDGWVGDKVKIINKPRKVLNAFNTAPLPDEGLNVEYAKLNTNTTSVTAQSAEGAELAFGKVAVTTATAPVVTYGGYTAMTRQEIERASVNIVDKSFTALAAKYAAATNTAVRAALVAATLPTIAIEADDTDTAGAWLGAVVDAATALDTYDYSLDTIIVSGNVFKAIATLTDGSGRPLLYTPNPVNNIGSVAGLSATLAGVPVVVDPGAATNTAWFASREALTTYESSGAPFRLQDADITTLQNAFSIYGYMAVAIHDVNGVIEAVIA